MCQTYAGQIPESYEPVTRRLRLNGHSTSIRLERSFWRIIDGMAARERISTAAFLSRLHDEVVGLHGQTRNFASLLCCACLIETGQAVPHGRQGACKRERQCPGQSRSPTLPP